MSEREWMDRHLADVTPLPFGERTAPSRRWQRGRRLLKTRSVPLRRAILVASVAGAVCGVGLLAWPTNVGVSIDGTTYRIGADQLVEQRPGVYRGAGVLIIATRADGTVAAASSFVHGGHAATGSCLVDRRVGVENCAFRTAGRQDVMAVDVFESGGWSRRYVGGPDVRIAARTMLPVPFPVGM